uniref:Flavin-containing monooxygenase n=1 Tax=Aureoumbra lagunensis TaxID=44058 RepID=A0A7S3K059_9STRA
MNDEKKSVCIVGAGISGLCAIKETREVGFEPFCFELCRDVGGVFNLALNGGRVYDNCHLTVSSRFMLMSSYPTSKIEHWHHSEYLKYIQDFSKEFDLLKHISFHTEVKWIEKEGDKWRVTTKSVLDDSTQTKLFDAVAICCGTHQIPKKIDLPGIEQFKGKVVHTKDYYNNESFVGKKVVSVGFGESGADIIKEVSNVAGSMTMSIRSYPFILPRQPDKAHTLSTDSHPVIILAALSQPIDWYLRPLRAIVLILGTAVTSCLYLIGSFLFRNNSDKEESKPKLDSFRQPIDNGPMIDLNTPSTKEHFELMHSWAMFDKTCPANKFCTKNATCVPNIVSGKLQVNASGIKTFEHNKVIFNDGTSADCEVLLACIGYDDAFPFLDSKYHPPQGVRSLYLHAFHPDQDLCSLSFIGFNRPSIGGIPLCSELICRYWALLISGQRSLPADVAVRAKVQARKETEQFALSPGVNSLMFLPDFLHEVVHQIGCEPNIPTILKYGGFHLLLKILTANPIPHLFRLKGPGATPELSAKAIFVSEGSVDFWFGVWLALQNALADLGIKRVPAYSLHDYSYNHGQTYRDYFFKYCGLSNLDAPLDKYKYIKT